MGEGNNALQKQTALLSLLSPQQEIDMSTAAAKELGSKGGKKKSARKTDACRANAKKPRGKRVVENGVWSERKLTDDSVVIESDDPRHDVRLVILELFDDIDQKLRYAKLIAKRLNTKEKV